MVFDLGYGLTAIGYFALFLLLLTSRKTGSARYLLLLSSAGMVAWALLHISHINPSVSRETILVLDGVRQGVWILFLSACIQSSFTNPFHFISRPTTLIALTLPAVTIVAAVTQTLPSIWQFSLHTLTAIQALVMTELLLRQSGEDRWSIKPLVIYLAIINLIDFVTYANALMLDTLSWDFFAARGYLFFVLLPLLVIAVRRVRHWGIDIFVSRDVVLHSTLLLLAGVYLILMALLGYLVKFFGGNWSLSIQLALAVISLALLAALLMSHQFRTKIKVFITKHFYANQYDYRVEWVKLTKTLIEGSNNDLESTYQTALKGWNEGLGYNLASLYKRGSDTYKCVASTHDYIEILADEVLDTLDDFFEKRQWIIDKDEVNSKPENYDALEYKQLFLDLCPFQIIIPILIKDELWGFVCLKTDHANKKSLNWELRDYISALTDQISSFIVNQENTVTLAENAQFAAFNRMSAFVVHDLKNVLAQINLIIENAKEHKDNPEFIDDTFETLEYTKERMDKMLKQLMQKNIDQQKHSEQTNITSVVHAVVEQKCAGTLPLPWLNAKDEINLQIDAEKLSNVLYHLIQNAQQATPDNGLVSIELIDKASEVEIIIADNGEGMSEDFVKNRLFRPFDTTKGNAGMGIGAYDAKAYIEECKGSLEVQSAVGEGSTFVIKLPKG